MFQNEEFIFAQWDAFMSAGAQVLEQSANGAAYWHAFDSAILSRQVSPQNGYEIATWLAQECWLTFDALCLGPFLLELDHNDDTDRVSAAVTRFTDQFTEFRKALERWCHWLRSPQAASTFVAAIRSRLLSSHRTDCIAMPRDCDCDAPQPHATCRRAPRTLTITMIAVRCARSALENIDAAFRAPPVPSELDHLGINMFQTLGSSLQRSSRTVGFEAHSLICLLHETGLGQTRDVRHVFAAEIMRFMRSVIHNAIRDSECPHRLHMRRDDEDDDPPYPNGLLDYLLRWKASVVDVFCQIALIPPGRGGGSTSGLDAARDVAAWFTPLADHTDHGDRVELEKWTRHFDTMLLHEYATTRFESLFDLVIDFPDSTPALKDIHRCFVRVPSLQAVFVNTAKKVLAEKLQHSGVRTEAILAVVIDTIRTITVLFSRNEANEVIYAVCGDALAYLRGRKDSVVAVVNEIVLGGGASRGGTSAATGSSAVASLFAVMPGSDDTEDGTEQAGPSRQWAPRGPPRGAHDRNGRGTNILKVLLNSLGLPALVKQYRELLGARLISLQGTADPWGVDNETASLERMKGYFGEEALTGAVVMLRDVAQSKRLVSRIRDQLQRPPAAGSAAGSTLSSSDVEARAKKTSCFVLSATCWPSSIVSAKNEPLHSFQPHPKLELYHAAYAETFERVVPSQRLKWLSGHSRVTLAITQAASRLEPDVKVKKDLCLPLVVASALLYVMDTPLTVTELSSRLKATEDAVKAALQPYIPSLFVVHHDAPAAPPRNKRSCHVHPQLYVTSSSSADSGRHHWSADSPSAWGGSDDEDDAGGEAATASATGSAGRRKAVEGPAGVSKEDLTTMSNLITAMLRAGGTASGPPKKTLAQLFNSMKMFGSFQGSIESAREIAMYLVATGKIATPDGGTTFTACAKK